MARTADVELSLWADPWFIPLPVEAKLLWVWAISNEHSSISGLYVVAEPMILMETGLTPEQFTTALDALHPTMGYKRDTGTVVIPSRPKKIRKRTEQYAKHVAFAVRDCKHREIQDHYFKLYLDYPWPELAEQLAAIEAELAGNGAALKVVKAPEEDKPTFDAEWEQWLDHFRSTTGEKTKRSKTGRKHFNARRNEGVTLDELKRATVGAHSDQHLREQGYVRPETILQESKYRRYMSLARNAAKPNALEIMAERAA